MKSSILTYEANLFLTKLYDEFNDDIAELIELRKKRKPKTEPKSTAPDDWKVLSPPDEILDRRVEITGPPVRKMIINALNSGANVFMADFEDSNSPTYENCLQGQINLRDAVRRQIDFTDPKTNKEYKLNKDVATLFVRPRGLHLLEKNWKVNGKPIRAALFDFGLYFFHNHKRLLENGSRPYFYLPKLEHHEEARLWNDIFSYCESEFELETGTIRATVLIETLPAAFQMDEILWELKEHSVGLNCGRWDYIFSLIKTYKDRRDFVLPDRDQVGMTQHFMRSYSQLLIQTCHKRGAHAIGGMAAQIPIKNDPVANVRAINKVKSDKTREVKDGHDGTWVAHPGLVPVAKEIFDLHMEEPNQINKQIFLNHNIEAKDLLCVPKGVCTEEALRNNINIAFVYINAWMNGNGCVPLNNLMEDAATAEISRAQVWQWCRWRVYLSNGQQVTKKWLRKVMQYETKKYENLKKYEETCVALEKLCLDNNFIDFLTLECYDNLNH